MKKNKGLLLITLILIIIGSFFTYKFISKEMNRNELKSISDKIVKISLEDFVILEEDKRGDITTLIEERKREIEAVYSEIYINKVEENKQLDIMNNIFKDILKNNVETYYFNILEKETEIIEYNFDKATLETKTRWNRKERDNRMGSEIYEGEGGTRFTIYLEKINGEWKVVNYRTAPIL